MALKNISLESHRRPGRAIGSFTTTSVRGQHGYNQVSYLWFVTQEDSHEGNFLFVPCKLHTFTASLSAFCQPSCAHSDSGAHESEGMSGERRKHSNFTSTSTAGSPISAKIPILSIGRRARTISTQNKTEEPRKIVEPADMNSVGSSNDRSSQIHSFYP